MRGKRSDDFDACAALSLSLYTRCHEDIDEDALLTHVGYAARRESYRREHETLFFRRLQGWQKKRSSAREG